MAFELKWSEEAIEDVESIAKDSLQYAKIVISKIFDKVEILKNFSKIGRIVPELNNENIRELFVYSYRIIYKIKNKEIIILAVVHGKRLLENYISDKNE